MSSFIPPLIGILITITATISLLLNVFVLFIIWKGGLMKPSGSNIYLLAFANIIGNCIQAAVIAFYLGPSVILQTDLVPDGPKGIGNRILSYLGLGAWYTDMQISAIIAMNRVSVIVFTTSLGKIFTRKVVKSLAFILFLSGFLLAFISHTIMPCCVPLFYYPSYWEVFLDEGFHYNDYFIDIPQNAISSAISIICYTIVYFYIKKAYIKIDSSLTSISSEARRRKEIRYAVQFGALSLFALFAWVFHRVFTKLISNYDFMPIVTFFVIIHGTMNSIIFLTINREVRKCVQRCFKYVSFSTVLSKALPLRISQQPVEHNFEKFQKGMNFSKSIG